jgi:hypothetical protein
LHCRIYLLRRIAARRAPRLMFHPFMYLASSGVLSHGTYRIADARTFTKMFARPVAARGKRICGRA